jgi:uncharacterized protein YbaP (TraB family)
MRRLGPLAASLAALLALSACNQQPSGPPAPALWEVTGPDGAHGWLFGTVHAMPDGYDWRTPTLDAAFAKADALVVEADVSQDPGDLFVQLSYTRGLGLPSQRVSGPKRIEVSSAFSKAGIIEHGLRDTETWAAALVLSGAVSYGEAENGADVVLMNLRGKKPLVELESVFGQLTIFDGLAQADQVYMLETVAGEIYAEEETGKEQLTAWRSGDTDTIEAQMNIGLLEDPELRQALLTERNRNWAGQIDTMLRSGEELFVAVGLAHLLGEDGLPALLEAHGFTVKRIQ